MDWMWPEKNSKEHPALPSGLAGDYVMLHLFKTVTEVCEYNVQILQYCEVGIIIPILKLGKVSL